MKQYLASSRFIDWQNPEVNGLAKGISSGLNSANDVAKACFEWVRDGIRHSYDFKRNPVTCRASDVLKHRTGYCIAKSHLLAALLRANGLPAGLCYQRMRLDGDDARFSLHGLNAVYLPESGWYRVDARGNKEGVNAQFCPPKEQLAFSINVEGEAIFPENWAEPHIQVVAVLENCKTYQEV